MQDHVDRIIQQWAVERPELDRAAMATLARILRAARLAELEMTKVFARFRLQRGEFDVLASLRRSGSPYRLSHGDLSRALLLSTGAMTNRIDRLEGAGLVRRLPDPGDRRGTLVKLTKQGRSTSDELLTAHVDNVQRILGVLSETERDTLADLLRKLLVSMEDSAAVNLDSAAV